MGRGEKRSSQALPWAQGSAGLRALLSEGALAAVSIISSLNLGFVSEVPWDAGHTLGVGASLMGIYHSQEEIPLLTACLPRSHLASSSQVRPVTAPLSACGGTCSCSRDGKGPATTLSSQWGPGYRWGEDQTHALQHLRV